MNKRFAGDELQEVKNTFSEFENERNGKICKNELISILCDKIKICLISDVDTIMDMFDVDYNGRVTFDNVSNIMAIFSYGKFETRSDIKLMFKVLKKDAEGNVSVNEILRVWKLLMNKNFEYCSNRELIFCYYNFSTQEMMDIVIYLDSNLEGKLNYEEFVRHMSSGL